MPIYLLQCFVIFLKLAISYLAVLSNDLLYLDLRASGCYIATTSFWQQAICWENGPNTKWRTFIFSYFNRQDWFQSKSQFTHLKIKFCSWPWYCQFLTILLKWGVQHVSNNSWILVYLISYYFTANPTDGFMKEMTRQPVLRNWCLSYFEVKRNFEVKLNLLSPLNLT